MATQALKYTQDNDNIVTMHALTPNGEVLVEKFRKAILTFCGSIYEAIKVMPFAPSGTQVIKDIKHLAKDDGSKTLKYKIEDINFVKGIAASMLDKEGTIFKLKTLAPSIANKFNTSEIKLNDEVKQSLEMFVDCFDFLLEKTLFDEDEDV